MAREAAEAHKDRQAEGAFRKAVAICELQGCMIEGVGPRAAVDVDNEPPEIRARLVATRELVRELVEVLRRQVRARGGLMVWMDGIGPGSWEWL